MNLDENVGCCVDGAGLAMATLDMVKYYDGESTDFLDVGGSPNPGKVVAAAGIITSDPNIRAILFDIFGGITRCDNVAKGMVGAILRIRIEPPVIIRLTGTKSGRRERCLVSEKARNLTEDGP